MVCYGAMAFFFSPVFCLSRTPELGGVFCNIGVYEPQQSASVAFMDFGNAHKSVLNHSFHQHLFIV